MRLTVAICTHNRARLLERTLLELDHVRRPEGVEVEFLLIDNASSDDTAAVAAAAPAGLALRVVHEHRKGLSNARNRAIDEATGDYICWTDDDVLVSPDWLVAYADAMQSHPDADIFGGPVEAWFPDPPANWLRIGIAHVGPAYAIVHHGHEPLPLTRDRTPFGANMAFRAAAQQAHRYDPQLGRSPDSMLSGEETTVIRAMLAGGSSGHWVPRALVRHYIPPERQSHAYLTRYYEAHGELIAITEDRSIGKRWFGRARYMFLQRALTELRHWLRLGGDAEALAVLRDRAIARGYFRAFGSTQTQTARVTRAASQDPA